MLGICFYSTSLSALVTNFYTVSIQIHNKFLFFVKAKAVVEVNQDQFLLSVQSLGHVQIFKTPWTAAHQTSLSFTISRSLLKFTSIESVMPSNHLILFKNNSCNASQVALVVKNPPANAGDIRDPGSIPGNVPWRRKCYSCLENPMDSGAWWAAVCRAAEGQTRLKQLSTHAHVMKHVSCNTFSSILVFYFSLLSFFISSLFFFTFLKFFF